MPARLTDALCTNCGLCCDGSLFADVELASSAEVTGLVILGLDIDEGDASPGLLSQPCSALAGRRCTIYAHRPKCCRTFECALLQDVRGGAVSVAQARVHIEAAFANIRRVRTGLTQLGERNARLPLEERCANALARDVSGQPAMTRRQNDLEDAVATLKGLLERTFMGRVGKSG